MGIRYSVSNPADTTLVTTAETVIATLSGVSSQRPGQRVDLKGQATVTTGAGTTGLTLRVRRDGLTGTLVDEALADTAEAAAASTETHDIAATDAAPGEIAGATYVLTVAQVGATGNGSAVHAALDAELVP